MTTKTVQVWTKEVSPALQDGFELTGLEAFKDGSDLMLFYPSPPGGFKNQKP